MKMRMHNFKLFSQVFLLIGICTMVQFSYSFMSPFLQEQFSLDKRQLGLLAAAYTGGNLVFSLLFGIWVDLVTFKKAMLFGAGLIGGALLLLTIAPGFVYVVLLSTTIGAGYSVILPLTNKGVIGLFPVERQAFAIGLKQAGAPLGIAIGSIVMPSLAIYLSWKFSYIAMFVLIFTVALYLYFFYKEPQKAAEDGYFNDATNPQTATYSVSYYENKHKNIEIISNILLGMSFAISQVIVLTFLVSFYHEQLGLSVVTSAAMLGIVQIAAALARPGMGWVVDCVGKKRLVLGLLGICNALTFIVLSLLNENTNLTTISIVSIMIGFVTMGWYGPIYSLMIDIIGKAQVGKASGLVATFNLIGMTAASPVFGYIYEYFNSYQIPLIIFAIIMLATTSFFLAIKTVLKVIPLKSP